MAPSSSLGPLFCSCPCAPAPLCSAPAMSNPSHPINLTSTHHQPHASRPVHRILRGSSCPIRIDCHGHSNYLFFDRCGRLQTRRRTERLPTFSPFAIAIDLRAALSPRALTALGLPRAPQRRRRRRRRQKLLVLDTVVACDGVLECVFAFPVGAAQVRRRRRLQRRAADGHGGSAAASHRCAGLRPPPIHPAVLEASVGGVRGFR